VGVLLVRETPSIRISAPLTDGILIDSKTNLIILALEIWLGIL